MDALAFLAHEAIERVDSLALAIPAGLAAGLLHTFMGPDHLGALMPLSVNRKLKAAWLGVRWGVGHSVGVFIVAIIFLAGREALDLSAFETWGERLVAVMLIGLGIWGLRQAARHHLHVHEHEHDGSQHAHLHTHTTDAHDPADQTGWRKHLHSHAAMGAGTMHGLAGMAHLLGVLPALAMPTMALSMAYLLCFAIGSIASMAVFAGTFGAITAMIGGKSASLVKGTMYFAAVGCILIGIFWLVQPLILPEDDEPEHTHSMETRHVDVPGHAGSGPAR
jgi:ABC-type nickel/cobalt efflux system permease component RcnA